MANKKFSEFVLKTSTSDVSHIVGYNGAENVQITPANFVTGGGTGVFLPLAGGTMTGDTIHNDNVKSIYGTSPGNDLQIFHDGSHSYLKDAGTGDLKISSNTLRIESDSAENMIIASANGAVNLYYNNNQKLVTTSTGISVTGGGVFTGSLASVSIGTTGNDISFSRNSDNYINAAGGTSSNIVLNPLNRFVVNTDNAERMRIDSSGNLGVGDSNPSAYGKFLVSGTGNLINANATSGAATFQLYEAGSGRFGIVTLDGTAGAKFTLAGNEKMRLDASGNLGLGVSNPDAFTSVSAQNLVLGNLTTSNGITVLSSFSAFGNLAFADGTGVNDQYKGLIQYGHTLNSMQFFTNNLERLRIDSSGNLGLGTSSASQRLHVKSATTYQGIFINGNVAPSIGFGRNDTTTPDWKAGLSGNAGDSFSISEGAASVDRLIIKANGDVGVGTVTPDSKMHIQDGSAGTVTASSEADLVVESSLDTAINLLSPDNKQSSLYFGSPSDAIGCQVAWKHSVKDLVIGTAVTSGGEIAFKTGNNAERMRINSIGELFIGATAFSSSTRCKLFEINPNCIALKSGASDAGLQYHQEFHNPNGFAGSISTNGSATAFNTTSDYRLKEDLQDFEGLDLVSKIPVYDYKWKADESRSYGVMAHELEEVLPQAVSGEKDAEEMQSVDYSKIVPLLVKSIQELSAKLEALECQCEKK